MKEKKCIGCGEKLQYDNPVLPGYIPKNILETRDNIICKRCFRLKHYGEYKSEVTANFDMKNIKNKMIGRKNEYKK